MTYVLIAQGYIMTHTDAHLYISVAMHYCNGNRP